LFDRDPSSTDPECTLGVIEAVIRFVASLGFEEVYIQSPTLL